MTPPKRCAALDWLVATPIAHRGLHDRALGRVENSLAAAAAAVAQGVALECDVQRTADGEAVVFHDHRLERLTGQDGTIDGLAARDALALPLLGSQDLVPSFAALLDRVAGTVPIVCEIKSRFDGDTRLADRVVEIAASYSGPLALKSFDPDVIRHLRTRGVPRPLGIVSEAGFDDPEWADLGPERRAAMASLSHFPDTRPDFLSFWVEDLPHAAAALCRGALGMPVMSWTVRTPAQRQKAAAFADQMVFEGFVP